MLVTEVNTCDSRRLETHRNTVTHLRCDANESFHRLNRLVQYQHHLHQGFHVDITHNVVHCTVPKPPAQLLVLAME